MSKFQRKFRRVVLETGKDEFFRPMARHFAIFRRRGPTLVVTFDDMKSRDQPAPRYPWGYDFVKGEEHSHLGIMMSRRNDWYRHADLFDFFDELRDSGFFAQFEQVIFYGSSMGGYGACVYSSAAPGARVFAMMPQTCLDQQIVPFETRYRNGFARGDWTDPRYQDAAEELRSAGDITILHDPYMKLDHLHVARLDRLPIRHLHANFCGHHAARVLKMMDMIGPVTRAVLAGEQESDAFHAEFRENRRVNRSYLRHLAQYTLARGKPGLTRIVLDWADRSLDRPYFPKLQTELQGLDQQEQSR